MFEMRIWLPPINLWSRPMQHTFDKHKKTRQEIEQEQELRNSYAYKKGYAQALIDVKAQLESLNKRRTGRD